jgi:4-aminobutyrate aminotransferase/(S)-3-amino-2-methylpropionate transaminase
VLEVMERENLPQRALHTGELIMQRLRRLQSRFDCIGDVRNVGAMAALEMVRDRNQQHADPDLTRALVQRAGANGLVLLSCGIYGNVIRLLAPLTISDSVLGEGLDILERSLSEALAERK